MSTFYLGGDIKKKVMRGKEKSIMAKELALTIELKPMKLLRIKKRKLTYDEFQDCLDIYENNQLYYKGNVDELHRLEDWFCSIREPYPEGETEIKIKEWRERERRRLKYSISDYCDKGVRKLLEE